MLVFALGAVDRETVRNLLRRRPSPEAVPIERGATRAAERGVEFEAR
jgi:hypothetical protein